MEGSEDAAVQFPAFPFRPYPIQLLFMKAVYAAIKKGGVAIVESPTGTGKTLSLICSALQWLVDHHQQDSTSSEMVKNCAPDDEPDWMSKYDSQQEEGRGKKQEKRKWLPKSRTKAVFPDGKAHLKGAGVKEPKSDHAAHFPKPATKGGIDDDEQFIVEDYRSDDECRQDSKRKLDAVFSSNSDEEVEDDEEPMKVFFCSRTHSQLSQFVGELQRTVFSSSLRTVTLGSRKNLCINSEVSKLKSSSRINDRCLELQRDKHSAKISSKAQSVGQKGRRKSTSKGCPLMSKPKLQKRFVDEAFQGGALDIEDLVDLGRKIGTCPYYASRRMVPTSDLVVLPYQSLLHSATRESLKINLKNCVVVIDEAHNLVDTVSSIHSCQVSYLQLKQVNSQLSEYLERFRKRLVANNRRYIEMLLVLIRSFIRVLGSTSNDSSAKEAVDDGADETAKARMMTINDFVFSLGIDNLNLFKIRRYIKESNIVQKVSSYGEKCSTEHIGFLLASDSQDKDRFIPDGSSLTGFYALAEFVLTLTNADSDGRVLVMPRASERRSSTTGAGCFLKFIMLNAAKHFAEVLDQARAVILAGGTLQPVQDLSVRLFPHLPEERVHMFGCGHIVPPESILPLAIARGPSNRTFDFTYQSRGSPLMMEELGRLMNNISAIVPEGVVVFFPSFEYESQVFNCWKSSGVLATLETRKAIFREPRDSASVEATLEHYRAACIQQQPKEGKQTGGLLLSVVGGKMSEGINFSDGMGRCVVMVGLPYPSPNDPELVERMRYVDRLFSTTAIGAGQKSREYYENLCMKAVNQSIGRAIRHKGDYASILLVDVRYTTKSYSNGRLDASGPASKLPGWIKERLIQVPGSFGEVYKRLHKFFQYNRSKLSEGS